MSDAGRICVESKDFKALTEKIDEITAVPAAGVEDAHAMNDVFAKKLIEDIDVNLAELLLQRSIRHIGFR